MVKPCYSDPVDVAQHYASFLKNDQKCDLVICLSHIGYDYTDEPDKVSDKILAARTENIDLILGGHTHTFLPEPQIFKNRQGKNVLVNQVGWAGLLLGRIDFFFDPNKNIQHISWNNQAIDSSIIA
ncbi:2',3'-cyclic-nucleotide 2'-phosphodiesterase (5'-nucleotidase family) [Chryseobacterium camelliae]|uniref:2',3'-cyclic-nucleotide 2'-phosphodiesterase (5'-nucleotidase family) n=1 Tax=Chryseobacterium camelliae TaxID=1265445 RepID=A0ABU0TDW3_9FLAO|nr:2',3'-cyclic-nucleotide 2'-phosphodiesterase (5'-nucleotidase family) [Chryseobacterium camelliae]